MNEEIINRADTPWLFATAIRQDNWHIHYVDLKEVAQGSPLCGNLVINGQRVFPDKLFGGPLLYHDNMIYIPLFIRKFCVAGFLLAVIDLGSMKLTWRKGICDLIWLDRIADDRLFFYQDIDKNKITSEMIDNG